MRRKDFTSLLVGGAKERVKNRFSYALLTRVYVTLRQSEPLRYMYCKIFNALPTEEKLFFSFPQMREGENVRYSRVTHEFRGPPSLSSSLILYHDIPSDFLISEQGMT